MRATRRIPTRRAELDLGQTLTRRDVLLAGTASAGATLLLGGSPPEATGAAEPQVGSFRYCLNTALLRGYRLGLLEQVDLAGEAGYDGIEPWIADVQK